MNIRSLKDLKSILKLCDIKYVFTSHNGFTDNAIEAFGHIDTIPNWKEKGFVFDKTAPYDRFRHRCGGYLMRTMSMKIYEYGNSNSPNVLIQPVDDHDLSVMESEIALIKEAAGDDLYLMALKVNNWNDDLSPWRAPAVFGSEDFGGKGEDTLSEVLSLCSDRDRTYHIGGYSLAGLFALWAAYRTDIFAGAAAASPSVWFPHFAGYMEQDRIKCKKEYLSLGNREEKTKNAVMATVGDNIRKGYELLSSQGIDCCLEWNKGNHFREPDVRTARAFSWLLCR